MKILACKIAMNPIVMSPIAETPDAKPSSPSIVNCICNSNNPNHSNWNTKKSKMNRCTHWQRNKINSHTIKATTKAAAI